jgi:hypothetical protein
MTPDEYAERVYRRERERADVPRCQALGIALTPEVRQLRAHVFGLAAEQRVTIEEIPAWRGTVQGTHFGKVLRVPPIEDEATATLALHELGHAAAPGGTVTRWATDADVLRAEAAAWLWAHQHARVWTAASARLAAMGLNSYIDARQPAASHLISRVRSRLCE